MGSARDPSCLGGAFGNSLGDCYEVQIFNCEFSRNSSLSRHAFSAIRRNDGHREEASILMVPGKWTTLLYADWIPQANGVRRELSEIFQRGS